MLISHLLEIKNGFLSIREKEKIKIHEYTTKKIKQDLKFGNTKISRIMKEYKETQIIPKLLQSHPPTKLTNDLLLHIHQCIAKDAHMTLKQMQKSALEVHNIHTAQSTISNGCEQLRIIIKLTKKRNC